MKLLGAVSIVLISLVAFSGCTKKESKENWNNVKEGTKKTWKSIKQDFSEATKELNE